MADTPVPDEPPAWQARKLLRAARVATLSTASGGQPFAALVTPATAPDGSVLLLLSSLSEHTRQLRAEPRCAISVVGAAEGINPQTAPRLTVTGVAAEEPDAGLKARWLAVHPYAAMYAQFEDFALWRIRPVAGLFVGGFARATRLRKVELTPDPVSVTAITVAADGIILHCNADHPDAMGVLSGQPGEWRMVGVDVDGCDLARIDTEATVRRVAWSAPVATPDAVRAEMIALLRLIKSRPVRRRSARSGPSAAR